MRELTYCYLRLAHPETDFGGQKGLSDLTSLSTEDSYVKNYKKSHNKGYKTARAVEVKGEHLSDRRTWCDPWKYVSFCSETGLSSEGR